MLEGAGIRSTRLPNGVLVITEAIPGLESISFGVWADAGSVDEAPDEFGIAHFLEHMLFKGTARRSAYELAEAIEDVGGQLNAYTERETTHIYARALAEHLPVAMELIADMICHSAFAEEEIDRERKVITEEIRKYESLPEERVHDLLLEGLWAGGALAHPILGSEESVQTFTRASMIHCWERHFSTERVLLTAAGKLDHDAFVAQAQELFAGLPQTLALTPRLAEGERIPLQVIEEDEEQVNFCWGGRTFPARDERNFPLVILDAMLGASTTSHLFQEVREKRGLAYDVGSYTIGFRETGFITATCATSPETLPEVVGLMREQIIKLRRDGLTPRELLRAKEQMKAGLALALESTSDRMRRLATHQLTWGEVYPIGYIIDRLERVTLDDIMTLADDVLNLDQWTFAAIGPVSEADIAGMVKG